MTEAMESDWYYKTRKFLSSDEKIETGRFDLMEDEINIESEIFISKDYQHTLALGNVKVSTEIRLKNAIRILLL